MSRFAPALAILIILAGAGTSPAESDKPFFFQKGDRIVFLGDSITAQFQYSNDIELYLTTRFPKWDLTFLNAGIGGDTATGGAGRFASQVLAEKPTAVTINFGMNDGGYGAFKPENQQRYLKSTEMMLESAQKAGARVALFSPNAVDRRMKGMFNYKIYLETQKQFYAPLQELAAKHHAAFADQYAVTRAALEKMEADKADGVKPFPDGVHTSSGGALLMAHAILTGLHAPALVSQVDIDAATGTSKVDKCTVEKLQAAATGVSFDRADEALPLPVQKDWLPLLPYVNQLKDLNWYGLKVTGLAPGKYALTIDDKDAGVFTAEELAAGVNLGNLTTGPVYEQAQKVFTAVNDKNELVKQRFHDVVRFQAPGWLADAASQLKPKELTKRMDQIVARQAEIYRLAQPTSHHFELKAAK